MIHLPIPINPHLTQEHLVWTLYWSVFVMKLIRVDHWLLISGSNDLGWVLPVIISLECVDQTSKIFKVLNHSKHGQNLAATILFSTQSLFSQGIINLFCSVRNKLLKAMKTDLFICIKSSIWRTLKNSVKFGQQVNNVKCYIIISIIVCAGRKKASG